MRPGRPAGERLVPVDFALDLKRTLRPLGGTTHEDGWWLAERTPPGAATLQITRTREGVIGRAWGNGADWILERVASLIGKDDDPGGLVTSHPLVSELARRHRGWRFGATGLVWSALVRAIVGQKVTGAEAARGMAGLTRAFSEPAPGPRSLWLPPDAERVKAAPHWEFHDLGIEKKRADTLRKAGAVDAQRLADLSPREARLALHRIHGVGVWTSAETVTLSHGDADAVAVGDFHLKNLVAWHLRGQPRGTDEEMLESLSEFAPHRGRVVRLLSTLGGAPRYGPRLSPRSFEYR